MPVSHPNPGALRTILRKSRSYHHSLKFPGVLPLFQLHGTKSTSYKSIQFAEHLTELLFSKVFHPASKIFIKTSDDGIHRFCWTAEFRFVSPRILSLNLVRALVLTRIFPRNIWKPRNSTSLRSATSLFSLLTGSPSFSSKKFVILSITL